MRKTKSPSNLMRILGFYSELKRRIWLVILVGSVSIVMFAFMPSFLKNAFNSLDDSFLNGMNVQVKYVIYMLIVFGGLALFNALFDLFCIFTILKYENKITTQKIIEVKRKLDVVPASFLEKFTTGDLTRRVANLTSEILKNVLVTVYTIARVSVFFITTSIMMFAINWILAIVVILSLPLCILVARFVSKRTQKFFNRYNKAGTEAYAYVDQTFSLKSFYDMHGIEAGKDFEQTNNKLTKTMIGENTALALNSVYIQFIQNFMFLLVTMLFGVLFLTTQNSSNPVMFGALPAFLMYSNRFLQNAVIVTTATNMLQGINAKAQRVFEILDCPDDVTDKEHINIDSFKHEIVFKKVSLVVNGEKKLDNVSFVIPQGSSVAIVGSTGCGKSSVVELLSKLAIPTGGQITIDGLNLEEINSRSYYKNMGLAMEKPFIFRGTVADNLLYGIRRALPENVMAVTKKLGSHEFIQALADGYETVLSENTSVLSTSQKQAINIARLVLQRPDIAIFHDSLTAADTITEKETIEAIMKMSSKQTKIFVSHRLASIEKCDIIWYMDKGKIIESGTHLELMKKRGRYFKAYTGE